MKGNFLFPFPFLYVLLFVAKKGNSFYGPYTCLSRCLFPLGYEKQNGDAAQECLHWEAGFFICFLLVLENREIQELVAINASCGGI